MKRNYVVIECFCVATEFGQGQEFLCRDRVFLCRDRVWPWLGFLCSNRVFLCHNRVWPWLEFLCPDRVWPRQEIFGCDKLFSYQDRVWGKGQESLRHDIAFYVATVGQGIASQPGGVRATNTFCRDSVAICCVAIENVMCARQTKPIAHSHDKSDYVSMMSLKLIYF